VNDSNLRERLVECGQLFHSRGWSVGTSSNYSAVRREDPLEITITVSGKDKGKLDVSDFVVVGQDGSPVQGESQKSSAETMLHVKAVQRLNAKSVLHTHSVWGTLLSDFFHEEDGFEISGYEMLKGLEGIPDHQSSIWVPIFENTQDIPALADEFENYLANHPDRKCYGYLIRRHGLYTWGKDVFSARRHIEVFEFLFEVIARRMMMTNIPSPIRLA
jgi:methylthioribulose-1-phosphate dehydratase